MRSEINQDANSKQEIVDVDTKIKPKLHMKCATIDLNDIESNYLLFVTIFVTIV